MPGLPKRLKRWLGELRFPVLLLITGTVLVIDLFVPDAIPLLDELLLALGTLLFAKLKRRPRPAEEGAGGEPD